MEEQQALWIPCRGRVRGRDRARTAGPGFRRRTRHGRRRRYGRRRARRHGRRRACQHRRRRRVGRRRDGYARHGRGHEPWRDRREKLRRDTNVARHIWTQLLAIACCFCARLRAPGAHTPRILPSPLPSLPSLRIHRCRWTLLRLLRLLLAKGLDCVGTAVDQRLFRLQLELLNQTEPRHCDGRERSNSIMWRRAPTFASDLRKRMLERVATVGRTIVWKDDCREE